MVLTSTVTTGAGRNLPDISKLAGGGMPFETLPTTVDRLLSEIKEWKTVSID